MGDYIVKTSKEGMPVPVIDDSDLVDSLIAWEGFLEHPIYWQTMLEVLLTQCSMIVGGKDYREYYKALTDIYIKTLEGTFGKVAIQQDIDWFNKH